MNVGLQLHTATTMDGHNTLPTPHAGDTVITLGRHARITCSGRRLTSRAVRGHQELRLTLPERCRHRLTVHDAKALLLRLVHGVRLGVTIHGERIHVRVRKGHLSHIHADARIRRTWHHVPLSRRGRGRLPRHATALRVSGRLKDGEFASAVAFLSRRERAAGS